MSPFKTNYKVTQLFGVNKDDYKQFGIEGHEGIDLIPEGSDWSVLCLADGQVVTDIDMAAKGGAYGVTVTVWHPQLKKATQYCHLRSNVVNVGQQIKKGEKLGVMGNTGNTSGAHLHLNLFDVDTNGIRLNKGNGFLGGTDPFPFLKAGDGMATMYRGYDVANPASMKAIVDGYFNRGAEIEQLKKDVEKAKQSGNNETANRLKDALKEFLK